MEFKDKVKTALNVLWPLNKAGSFPRPPFIPGDFRWEVDYLPPSNASWWKAFWAEPKMTTDMWTLYYGHSLSGTHWEVVSLRHNERVAMYESLPLEELMSRFNVSEEDIMNFLQSVALGWFEARRRLYKEALHSAVVLRKLQ